MEWTVDFSSAEHAGLGLVAGSINGHGVRGVYDPVTGKSTANVGLDYWLPQAVAIRLDSFASVLAYANAWYGDRAEQAVAQREINWCGAITWGVGGAVGALAGVGVGVVTKNPTVGATVGGAVAGASGSILSDVFC